MKIKIIGIDIDWYAEKNKKMVLKKTREKCRRRGRIIQDYPTKRGHHLRIKLNAAVSFRQSIEMRYILGDDARRLFFDIRRQWHGLQIQDVLWERKHYLNPDRKK